MRLSLELKKGIAEYTGVFPDEQPGGVCVGFLDTETVDPNGLDAAIAFAMEGGFEESEGRQVLSYVENIVLHIIHLG